MVFKESSELYATEVERRQGENVLYINFLKAPFVPSISDNAAIMARVVDILADNPNISRIIFVQQRNYNFPPEQVFLLAEIAGIYNYLVKQQEILAPERLAFFGNVPEAHNELNYTLTLLRQDPITCYLNVNKLIKRQEARLQLAAIGRETIENYLRFLQRFKELLENTRLIGSIRDVTEGYSAGDRSLYKAIFRPDILPNFTFTRLVAQLPEDAEFIDQYDLKSETEKITVTILKKENEPKYFYHIAPPEYTLSEEQHMLLNLARNVMIEHRPKAEEFLDPEKTRQVFFNVARDLITELGKNKGLRMTNAEIVKMAEILVRHTIGFGLIEVLLKDTKLQDVVLNAPIAQNPIFVRHQDYDECVTNIIPSYEDADSWAAKLRLQSGRPLDEANPILDTDLVFGGVRARVAAIQEPLSPSGLGYAIRRHRDAPWTLPLFIHNKMINSFGAGLLSFLIDGSRTLLIAGTRSSGKTSMLGSLMLEIMPKFRVITVEDSVTGDSRIIVKENGKFRKTTIGELIDEKIEKNGFIDGDDREKELNCDGIEVFSINREGKVVLSKASKFIRHRTNKPILNVITSSGKKIKVTEDHSLFTIDEKKIIKSIKTKEIKGGDFIAIPRALPFDNSLNEINILDNLDKLGRVFICGENIEKYVKDKRRELFDLAYSLGYKKSTIQNWTRKNILPSKIFEKVKKDINEEGLGIKGLASSEKISVKIKLDETFLNFVGLWIADGCYDKKSIIVSVEEEENKKTVRDIAERFNACVKGHSDKFSSMVNSSLLRKVMTNVLELNGNSYTKEIPNWAFNLSKKQAGWLLKGYFSGDGCASDKEVVFSSCSQELISDISSLLLGFGIVLRIGKERNHITPHGKDNTIGCRIGHTKMIKKFMENIGFLVKSKQEKLEKLSSRISTHDTSDIIPISSEVKSELSEILGNEFAKYDYIERENNIGRMQLLKMLSKIPAGVYQNPIDLLRNVANADLFWDKVVKIERTESDGYVYDISVPECENFICENIVAHNTLELPVDALRKLGYDILRMKVRSALTSGTSEIEASEGIRTSLRLGDSALIVGEVRSEEARALYEAMRVGALANVVAGTIHGDSPYGVFDRVVNDLKVPSTSFKATDLILVANPVKTPDGLHSMKRVMSLTEVRKHWINDPEEEGGFVDLMRYNVEKDELEPTDELINGESDIIKRIAGSVKGWAGNWDAVYDNIILRGRVKQEIVDTARKLGKPQLMEAEFNQRANNAFHAISDKVREEIGIPSSEKVFPLWKEWLDKNAKAFL